MAGGSFKSFIGTIRKKPTRAPDRKTDAEANGVVNGENTSVIADLLHLGPKNAETVIQAVTTIAEGEPLDDKELLLEHGVNMLQTLPKNSGLADKASKDFIKMLWHDLPHPAVTTAGPTARYRQPDGSGNNPWKPEMGKAGTAYSRNVPPSKPKGPNLPDPELVFEQLLKRRDNEPFRKHPSGLNRLFFSFATIVIHECFQTSYKDKFVNETSSYVDLSTLYGNNGDAQKRVRTYKNGLIYPDSIASERIMMMPPGVIALLIMFSRNHNTIAQSLLSVNEQGEYRDWDHLTDEDKKKRYAEWDTWTDDKEKEKQYHDWSTLSDAQKFEKWLEYYIPHMKTWQDEDIFQIARNINVGFFATIVLKDYVAAILNTPRANTDWWLNLGEEIKNAGSRVERGTGNVVSVEFAVLYHWHAALSAEDAWWMEDRIKKAFETLGEKFGRKFTTLDEVTVDDFQKIILPFQLASLMGGDPKHPTILPQNWEFGGLKRGEGGRFSDTDLAELMKDCVEAPAHAFGAHGTPASLRFVDILGMMQARDTFNVCTMNEFRKYLNLQPYKTFEDWNPDKETARAAELLYGHIDNLELYPGLMAEVTKPAMPGSGVCPGQTTGRGILDDAVALVRGDRFLSYDLNSNTLTNWGVSKLGSGPGGSYGGVLPHLIMQGLPAGYTGTSTYALLPFYTPEAVKGILRGNKAIENYDLDRPASDRTIVPITTQAGCKAVFEDRENFRVMYQHAVRQCTDGHDFMLGWDEQKRHDERSKILHKAFYEDDFESKVTKFFRETVPRLIKESSLKYQGSRRSIDIVRDVTNVAPIMWLAQKFAIPLKTWEQPRGLLTIPETFDALLVLFMYQSFNILPENEWKLREASLKAAPVLREIFEAHLKTQQGWTEGIVDWLAKGSAFEVGPEADRLYHALNESKLPIGDMVGDCIGMAPPIAGNLTQQASLLIDLFLSPQYKEYKDRIIILANKDDPESQKELEGFVFEGMRHAGVVPGVPRVAAKDITIEDGSHSVHIKAHQTVLVATSKANMDPDTFPNPEKLDPHRPRSAYTLFGHGLHYCFGARLVGASLTAILKEVFKLKNLRRAKGKLGQFTITEIDVAGVKMRHYLDANAKESPIPTTLTLEYDE